MGLICLDNVQMLQPFSAGGGSGGRSIITLNQLKLKSFTVVCVGRHVRIFKKSYFFLQKLASVSPELPKLVELLTVHQPKENEILLVGGLDASDACQARPRSQSQVGSVMTSSKCFQPLNEMARSASRNSA